MVGTFIDYLVNLENFVANLVGNLEIFQGDFQIRTNVNDPTTWEGFWAYRLDSFIPLGLNIRYLM